VLGLHLNLETIGSNRFGPRGGLEFISSGERKLISASGVRTSSEGDAQKNL
jgi:hypothetical protein